MKITRPRQPRLEMIRPDPAASFFSRHAITTHYPFAWHYHPEMELTWVARGSGMRFVGDSIAPFSDGDLVLIGSNLPHTWQSPARAARGGVESIVIQFRRDLWGEAMASLPEFAGVRLLLQDASRGVQAIDAALCGEVSRAMREILAAPPGSMGQMMGLLSALRALAEARSINRSATRILCKWPGGEDRAGNPAGRRLRKVLQHLNETIEANEPLTQAVAARIAGMSPASFSRFFHRQVGRTFVRYVTEWRVGRACRELLQSDASITEIAFDAGFENLSNFNRRFKEVRGMTPREFRKMGMSRIGQR